MYRRDGLDFADQLRGMYAIAIYDPGEPIAGAAFNGDGSKVVMITKPGRIIEWDTLTGEELRSWRRWFSIYVSGRPLKRPAKRLNTGRAS